MSELPLRLRGYYSTARFMAYTLIALLPLLFLFMQYMVANSRFNKNTEVFILSTAVPLPVVLLLLVFFLLWVKHAALQTQQLLPSYRTQGLTISGNWFARRFARFKQMRELWPIWVSGPAARWHRNPAILWQVLFLIWFFTAKNGSKLLKINATMDVLREAALTQMLLLFALAFLTLKLTKTVQGALKQHALTQQLAKPPQERTRAALLALQLPEEEMPEAPSTARPVPQQNLTLVTRHNKPREGQDPIIWRKR